MLFSPGIYEHAAALIEKSPWQVSRDENLLVKAHHRAWTLYHHPMIVAGIDVYNTEPEAYGAHVAEPSGTNVPAIAKHPCETLEEVLQLIPFEPMKNRRMQSILNAGRRLKALCQGAEVCVPVCGPFALGIGLLGMDELLISVIEDPELLEQALYSLLPAQFAWLDTIYAAGLQPVIFESGTCPPLLPAAAFKKIEAPLLKELFRHAKNTSGAAPRCVIGGDASLIVQDFLEAGPGWVIAPSETNQKSFLSVAGKFPLIHTRVNMAATTLLESSFDSICSEADRCIELAASHPNSSIGCGVVPYETNPSTVCNLVKYLSQKTHPEAFPKKDS